MNLGCRKCRREGEKLLLKGERCLSQKCAMVRRAFPPGQHGNQMQKKPTEFCRQLREKQKLKKIYGLGEAMMLKYYKISEKHAGNTAEQLITHLELRLDNILYRVNLSSSRSATRQIASHGRVKINGKRVTVPSIILKPTDVISFSKNVDTSQISDKNISWLKADAKLGEISLAHIPARDEIGLDVNENLVVEFYSR